MPSPGAGRSQAGLGVLRLWTGLDIADGLDHVLAKVYHAASDPFARVKVSVGIQATACKPLRCMMDKRRNAGPPGRLTPLSQSDTRLRETLR